jgi:hypothetical protein
MKQQKSRVATGAQIIDDLLIIFADELDYEVVDRALAHLADVLNNYKRVPIPISVRNMERLRERGLVM